MHSPLAGRHLRIGVVFLVSLLGIACSGVEGREGAWSIEEAKSEYFSFKLNQAQDTFSRVWEDEMATAADRVEAAQRLARIAALIDLDTHRARQLLSSAEALGVNRAPTLSMLSRIEREAGNYPSARDAARRAADAAQSPYERRDADVEFARSVFSEMFDHIMQGRASSINRALLQEAFTKVDGVLQVDQGELVASEVALGLSLLLGKGPDALRAWRSYFHVPEVVPVTRILEEPYRALEPILMSWEGDDLAAGTRAQLVQALAGSRMFAHASMVALTGTNGLAPQNAEISEIIAYHKFLRKLDQITVAYYRSVARGNGSEGVYREEVEREAENLWRHLQSSAMRPSFSFSRFRNWIRTRFGADLVFKRANGYFGLHMGHRVIDEQHSVVQYSKQASLRFVVLDFMVSNGYSSWYWDGSAQVGGWANNPTIIQVRSAYADNGISAWRFITDPKKRKEAVERIAENSAVDDSRARENFYAYLPGLDERIGFNHYERLRDRLMAKGLAGARLRLAFIAEIERISFESSIVAHEGRHAIDAQDIMNNWFRSSAVREFRAKLSEVAFSSAPFLALRGGILIRSIGDDTSHGQANERIMKGIVRWMREHTGEIDDLDPGRPLLPQLDQLTDEQLREAFRSMDPLAS